MRPSRHASRRSAFSLSTHTIDLPLEEKIAYGGALVSLVATLLPWFSFTTEQSYNGLQNVTWLIGYSILFLSILVLVPWGCALLKLKTPSVLTRQTWHWGITGGMIVLLTLIALSVYGSFEWISIRSTIHFGPYATLLAGLAVLGAAQLNRSRMHRVPGHVAHIERSSVLEDEEIERYLRPSPVAPEDSRRTPQGTRVPEPAHESDDMPSGKDHQGPPAMFDV